MKVLFLILSLGLCHAFTVPRSSTPSSVGLNMVPRFNGEKWITSDPAEGPEAGYSATKSLLMHGPRPFFERVFRAEDYEQAVLKFMAGDKCTRAEAEGNMDAYLRNPNDWAFNRLESERTGVKLNYSTIAPKNLILVVVWGSLVSTLLGRGVYCLSTGDSFYSFGPFV